MCNAIRSSNARLLTSFASPPNVVIVGGTGGVGMHSTVKLRLSLRLLTMFVI